MTDNKWQRIEAHIQELDHYVNSVKSWLKKHQAGDLVLSEAKQQWQATRPEWHSTLLDVGMGEGNIKLPVSPPNTPEGSPGEEENQPVD